MIKKIFTCLISLLLLSSMIYSYEEVNTPKLYYELTENDFELFTFKIDENISIALDSIGHIYIFNRDSINPERPSFFWIQNDYGQKEIQQLEKFRLGNGCTWILDLNFDDYIDVINYQDPASFIFVKFTDITGNKIYFSQQLTEISLKNVDIYFCIINGKRGFKFKQSDKNKNVFWSFYYWSSKTQSYIFDETVTQEQIKNAYCPEDYFAYNGLKFSKLDSKLTAEDLRDLDKAQLRLMRNAVYARHGRTFKSVDLQSLWECYTWYKKNPNYSDSLLTDIDKYNIELIQKYEAK